ncbi:MAG: PPOX class F420-dependent oxidoreductase [Micromonosporaceae bacterium]
MTVALPEFAKQLLDDRVFAVLATVSAGGSPQSSVIWVKRDAEQVIFSTIRGRLKTRHMERNPKVSLCLYDPKDPYAYVELRGTVTMDEAGGAELIDELSRAYDGKPWTVRPHETRLVCRVTPSKVIEHVAAQSPRFTGS